MFINIPIHFIDTYIHALESLEGEKPVGQYLVTRPITDLGLGLFLKQGITQREKSKFKPKSKYLTSFENIQLFLLSPPLAPFPPADSLGICRYSPRSRPELSNRTFCDGRNVLQLHCLRRVATGHTETLEMFLERTRNRTFYSSYLN